MTVYDTIIIGGGPGGYSAAIYAARFNMSAIVLAKERGGLMTKTHLIENWPGEQSISGFDLMMKVEDHVRHLDVPIKDNEVIEVRKENNLFIAKTSKEEFKGKTLILATGTKHRRLPAKGEKELYGKGVSYCATCDGFFFKDKVVAMVGGGDAAAKEALMLSEHCKKVFIIYRGDRLKAEPINADRVKKKEEEGKIKIIYNTNIIEILGTDKVTGVKLDNPYDDSEELALDGIFGAIGQLPQNILAGMIDVELNKKGEIIIDKYSRTNVAGVFAAGDITDNDFKQGLTAAAQGIQAAHSAFEFLDK